jgi:tape measure domain-containing protein
MAAINKDDLIRDDALQNFVKLNLLIQKNIEHVEKLKKATLALDAVRGTDKEARALRKVAKYRAEYTANMRETILLEKKSIALKDELAMATKRAGVQQKKLNGLMATMKTIMSSMLGPLVIFYKIWQGIGALKDTVIRLDAFRFALEKITTSSARTVESMRYLIDIAERFGVSLNVAADRYVKFYTAAKQSGLTLEDTRTIFTNMSKAAGVLGLKGHEVEGVFLALEQMLSKGKVTTEELRRQLGERLPGAFGIMADAVGVGVEELDALLKKGQVLSADVLPRFSRMYNEAFGIDQVDRVETLAAAQSRLSTSWTALVFEVENGSGAISSAYVGAFDAMTHAIKAFSAELTIFNSTELEFWEKNALLGRSTEYKIQFAKELNARRDNLRAMEEYVELQSRLSKDGVLKNLLGGEIGQSAKNPNTNYSGEEFSEHEKARRVEGLKLEKLTTEEVIARIEALKKANAESILMNTTETLTVDILTKQISAIKAKLQSTYDIKGATSEEAKEQVNTLKRLEAQLKVLKIKLGLMDEIKKKGEDEKYYGLSSLIKPDIEGGQEENILNVIKEVKKEIKNTSEFERERLDILNVQLAYLERQLVLVRAIGNQQQMFGANSGAEALGSNKEFEKARDYMRHQQQYGNIGYSLLGAPEKIMEDYNKIYNGDMSNFKQYLDERGQLAEEYLSLSIELMNGLFDLGNEIFNAQLENIQAEMRATEEKYDKQYELAEGDKKHQEDITRQKEFDMKQLEKEELRIRQRQAKFEKAQKLVNAAINTAVSITQVSWNPVLTALVAAIGAAQIATIIAQPIPKYKDGRLPGQDEYAIVGDGGRSEVIVGARGVRKTPARDTLTHLDKTDMVLPSTQAYKMMVMNSIKDEVRTNFETKEIEKAIENGFKKAQVNNYLKMPKIDINVDRLIWLKQNAQFN